MESADTSIHDFDFNLINEYFTALDRQGPGSPEATLRALSFIDNLSDNAQIADLGCGTGGQTMVLAQNTKGTITALDLYPGSIEKLNAAARNHGLHHRIKGVVGSMDKLPFPPATFDLIWSEGAIAQIGFEKGLTYWKDFLKKDGFVAVTYESWFAEKRPPEIEKFWLDAVPEMNTIAHNVAVMQKAGFLPAAVFTLPESCWTETYFAPQKSRQDDFLKAHPGSKTAEALVINLRREEELYQKYKQYYGYVFYVGKKAGITCAGERTAPLSKQFSS